MSPKRLRITGGVKLKGTVTAGGAKNAALPIMAAALLTDEPLGLLGVPRLTDVATMSRLLRALGTRVVRRGREMELCAGDSLGVRAPERLVRQMRASFCVLGPLLARCGRAVVPLPGGCRIGDRPVDLHLRALEAMGARIELRRGAIVAEARRLQGTTVDMCGPRGPSVTGTANVLSAAVLAHGETIIEGAAREPEIVDLCHCLKAMGARIDGIGGSVLRVEGVARLRGTTYRIIPDRIETATLLLAAAITGGAVTVRDCRPEHLARVVELLQQTGCEVAVGNNAITLQRRAALRPLQLAAEPYPGIPTDLQAQWTALLALADGQSLVTDRVFPARFDHVAELRRLGAGIELDGATAVIDGGLQLTAARLLATDLRASAALVLAALAAEGETAIEAGELLDRGYERLDRKLAKLGARIVRERAEDPQQRVAG